MEKERTLVSGQWQGVFSLWKMLKFTTGRASEFSKSRGKKKKDIKANKLLGLTTNTRVLVYVVFRACLQRI